MSFIMNLVIGVDVQIDTFILKPIEPCNQQAKLHNGCLLKFFVSYLEGN